MKAIFFTEGGKQFGFGHIVRCTALQEAFEEKGIASELIVNADNTVRGVLKSVNFRMCDWLKNQDQALRMIGKEDIVIIDSYLADLEFYQKASKKSRKAAYMDDYQRLNYPKGIIINSAIYAPELRYTKDNGNMCLLGIRYSSLRKEFWDIPKSKKIRRVQKILITFGGMDYSDLIEKIVKCFKNKLECTFHCIDFVKKKSNPLNFLQSILESDLCISGGGQTIYNLARCGVPTIGVCLSENQLLNLKCWDKTRFLKFVGKHKDVNLLKNLERFFDAPDFGEFLKGGCVGQKYIDGQGARRVVQALLS